MFNPFSDGTGRTNHHLVWKTGKKRRVYTGPIFNVCSVERTSSDGRTSSFIEVDAPTWVTIIPWFRTSDGVPMFVMVEQYRHGSDTVTREFPAGVVEEGEEPKDAALREMGEECALSGGQVTKLGEVSPNSAFMNNRAHFFLIEDVVMSGEQALDENEQLEVLAVPVQTVIEAMGTGIYDNGIMMIALGYFMRLAEKRPELIQTIQERNNR
ncbi:MAG: NUDIX hydrolase [Sphaerochaeta sp.]|jgi:8-oxo-dGTP pyrophosphatase MutT (NUDIX family)|nr:NUDIX hydrolase [Sphaerochaeta sp.]